MNDEPEKVEFAYLHLALVKWGAFEDLFPGVLVDGVFDTTRLGELLDMPVAAPGEGREWFGLVCGGKQHPLPSLLILSRGVLVPDLNKSVDFDSTSHVFIDEDGRESWSRQCSPSYGSGSPQASYLTLHPIRFCGCP
ncbi:hypothetical protein ACFYE2_11635 [Kocuria sp. CPCC 205300]|uniref:hypothetical protein n=1 Tax=Kocuria sabuli TaxID=3071448 RepID=UPI0036D9B4C7